MKTFLLFCLVWAFYCFYILNFILYWDNIEWELRHVFSAFIFWIIPVAIIGVERLRDEQD